MAKQRSRSRTDRKSQPGRLRIVAGKWRSRLVPVADVRGLRPTSERIRETLFNWLAPRIEGARCLDLFAGTGALGLEALSRGAASVVFVERAAKAAASLQASIGVLDATGAVLQHTDAQQYLARDDLPKFDIVFLDPPFADNLHEELCRLLSVSGCLAKNAKIYIEQDRATDPATLPDGWKATHEKTTGNVRYSLVSVENVGGDQ